MGFKELEIRSVYRTYFEDVVKEFIKPVLNMSSKYHRGSGYFSLLGMYNILNGIIPMLKRRDEIKIIISPLISSEDISLLNTEDHENVVVESLLNELEKEVHNKEIVLLLLAKLIKEGLIQIKVAFSVDGLFHEKIGLMYDSDGNVIEFIGSLNETENAYKRNVESIMVMKSWENDQVRNDVKYFTDLWEGRLADLRVIALPEVVEKKLYTIYENLNENSRDLDVLIEEFENSIVVNTNSKRKLYDYQENAVHQFLEYGSHFFEMATGTGKTFTTIKLIKKIIESNRVFVQIIVPQVDLQTQWFEELKEEGFNNIYLFGGKSNESFNDNFSKSLISYNLNKSNNNSVVCISVYDTFFNRMYLKSNSIENLFIIVDEAHNLTQSSLSRLPQNPKYKLGLSATPRKHDLELSLKIKNYFIDIERESYKFTLEEAIERGFLSRYNYYPIFVNLEPDEFEEFKTKTNRISVLTNMDDIDKSAIERIAMERSLIIKKARNKIKILDEILDSKSYDFKNSVVYCGQGKVGNSEELLIDHVIALLNKHKFGVSSFTSKTENRHKVLREFENGYFDTLVAIKCFDEGVDVPKLDKIYILASDRLERQTIQRRGRVLRKCKETGKNLAYIYDFVVIPKMELCTDFSAKKLLEIEFGRVKEYMRLSENKDDYTSVIVNLEELFDIDKISEEVLDDEKQES